MARFIVPLVVFGLLVIVFLRGLTLDPSEVPSPLIGKPVPTFELPTLQDPSSMVSDQRLRGGQPHLVNVWATWCVGCRQEHDMLLAIAQSGRVPILGLNWKDNRTSALNWLRQLGDPYVVNAFDVEGRTAIDWGVYGAPETFLVDGDGIVRHKHIGPLTQDAWEEDFLPRLAALESGP